MDWIDKIKKERDTGINRTLYQSEHATVNSRYPGCTLEHCCSCGTATGNAGQVEDSLFTKDDGPFCQECWREMKLKKSVSTIMVKARRLFNVPPGDVVAEDNFVLLMNEKFRSRCNNFEAVITFLINTHIYIPKLREFFNLTEDVLVNED